MLRFIFIKSLRRYVQIHVHVYFRAATHLRKKTEKYRMGPPHKNIGPLVFVPSPSNKSLCMLIGTYTVHRPTHVAYHNRTIFEQQHDSYVQLIKLKQFNHDENYVYRVFR